jgi:hypothetical protein
LTVTGSFIAALILASSYLLGRGLLLGREGSKEFWERRRWISAAAGVSVAYIFIDVLPELGAQQRAFAEAMGSAGLLFVEERIYAIALASFVLLYGLDHMVLSKREERREAIASGKKDTVYVLHLAGFAVYSCVIGYLLVERAERGWLSLSAYTFAMAVHFLIVGHSLDEEHGNQHGSSGRWLLVLSPLAGWLLGSTVTLSEPMFARLFAILAGGVVITSIGHEMPGDRKGRFLPFCLGALFLTLALFTAESA